MNDVSAEIALPNPYDTMLPEAVGELRRILHLTKDEKLRAKVAEDIISLSSYGKSQEATPPIVITSSNVQFIMQVVKETFGNEQLPTGNS